jgi:glycosyltransferase involved in cell wall biosynthesis
MSMIPYLREVNSSPPRLTIGTLPIVVHAEGLLAGRIHRNRLRQWDAGWAVGSRHAGALLAAGVKYAVWEATTVHDELSAIDPSEVRRSGRGTSIGARFHRVLRPVGDRLEGLVYRRAAVLVAMSEYSRQLMVSAHDIAPERVHLLPPPPTLDFLRALEQKRSINDERADGGCRLLFVGRVDDPRKHFTLLLDALARLEARGVDARVTVVGPHTQKWSTGWQSAPVARRVTLLGRVSTEELAAAYRSHDLLVVPSRQEGYGLVVAEALHAGLPIVSTRCGGPEGMIRHSGAGLLTGQTAEEFAAAIERLLMQPLERQAMVERALEYAHRELSHDVFARRAGELTELLLGTPIRRAAA